MPQTIRLEFAKSNTKVSKPKQQAAAATTHPSLMHPLTGRKYNQSQCLPLIRHVDNRYTCQSCHNYCTIANCVRRDSLPLWDLKFTRLRKFRLCTCGLWHRVVMYVFTNVLKEPAASIFRA
jgi:hypothetical protein